MKNSENAKSTRGSLRNTPRIGAKKTSGAVVMNGQDVQTAHIRSSTPSNYNRNYDYGVSLYVREIGQIPLITTKDEIALAARIKKGDPAARKQLIEANLRLVVKIAREYEDYGLPLLDLISEGNLGLIKAVARFDPAKGGKFSTYGSWWIKQAVKRALDNQSKTIRIPAHVVDKLAKARKVERALTYLFGRQPTEGEIAEEIHMDATQYHLLRQAVMAPTSLQTPIDDNNGILEDVIRDDMTEIPDQALGQKTALVNMMQFVDKLDQREATILHERFGLDGEPERTLGQVGEKFGITRERVRQIQRDALKKLRRMIERHDRVQV